MSDKNYAVWYDNQPEFNSGDVCLFKESTGEKYIAKVLRVEIHKYDDEYKSKHEQIISSRKNCCGQKDGRGIRSKLNDIIYILEGRPNANEIYLLGGIERANEYLNNIEEMLELHRSRMRKAVEELGFNVDY